MLINHINGKVKISYDFPFSGDTFPENGLFILTGKNSSGKTSVLKSLFGHMNQIGYKSKKIIYIPAERTGVDDISSSQNTGGLTLLQTTANAVSYIQNNNNNNNNNNPSTWHQYSRILFSTLLTENETKQKPEFQKLIQNFFDINYISQESQWKNSDSNLNSSYDGSGLRAVFYVMAALTSGYPVICIDEPEISLEPSVQKLLYGALLEKSKDQLIIIATHSPHFINRQKPENNFIVDVKNGKPEFEVMTNNEDLYKKIIIDKLGFSLTDLFLPEKIVIVEGDSDLLVLRKYLELSGVDLNKFYLNKLKGIGDGSKEISRMKIIEESLSVHLRGKENFYPYFGKVFLVVDKLDDSIVDQKKMRDNLNHYFSDNWSEISSDSSAGKDILSIFSEDQYIRAGMSKSDVIKAISVKNSLELCKYKVVVVKKIILILNEEDLEYLNGVQGLFNAKKFLEQ
jgi:predicted ATPase